LIDGQEPLTIIEFGGLIAKKSVRMKTPDEIVDTIEGSIQKFVEGIEGDRDHIRSMVAAYEALQTSLHRESFGSNDHVDSYCTASPGSSPEKCSVQLKRRIDRNFQYCQEKYFLRMEWKGGCSAREACEMHESLHHLTELLSGVSCQVVDASVCLIGREPDQPRDGVARIALGEISTERINKNSLCGVYGQKYVNAVGIAVNMSPDKRQRIIGLNQVRRGEKGVLDCLYISLPLIDRYAQTFPPRNIDEETYLQHQTDFLRYVEEGPPSVRDFVKKHVRIVDRKAPSMRTKIKSLINLLDLWDWGFEDGFPDRVVAVRKALLHGATVREPELREISEKSFVLALAGLFRELGINPQGTRLPVLMPQRA
jgi:hypothetical protein